MFPDYRLHYAPDNASLCVRLALEEAGLPYRTALVDRQAAAQRGAAYLRLNPNGLIPVLETPDGAIFETGAILLWLSERHAGLMPEPGAPGRGAALSWLFWLSNTLHPALRMLFYPDAYAPTAAADLRAVTQARLVVLLDLLEAAGTDWLDRPSALSCYAAPMLRWMALYPPGETGWFDLSRWPRLADMARMMEARPAARAAIRAEGLGETPFSAPSYPDPPEGSAV